MENIQSRTALWRRLSGNEGKVNSPLLFTISTDLPSIKREEEYQLCRYLNKKFNPIAQCDGLYIENPHSIKNIYTIKMAAENQSDCTDGSAHSYIKGPELITNHSLTPECKRRHIRGRVHIEQKKIIVYSFPTGEVAYKFFADLCQRTR